jgi:phage terminase small subunit
MAGVAGRSGGARPNTGGKRPGAGRKPKPIVPAPADAGSDMLKFLMDVALGKVEANATQVRAAVAAVQYTHTKRSDGGKRDEANRKAEGVSAGRFAPKAPPKLVVNNK